MKELRYIQLFDRVWDKKREYIKELKNRIEKNEREKIMLKLKMEDLEEYGMMLKKELEIRISILEEESEKYIPN